MGLAVVAGGATRVTDAMMMAAAVALSELAPAVQTGEGRLLPELKSIRDVSKTYSPCRHQTGYSRGLY